MWIGKGDSVGRIGEYLLEREAITESQLEEAVRFQSVYGGRIGTVLIDLAYLEIEELASYLSDFHQVPLPPADWVESPEEKALNLVPTPLIRRCKVLPMKLEKKTIHVLMMDPCSEEDLEFIRMATNRDVVPYVLPERKILYWLESHLGIDRHPRFLGLITRPRGRGITAEEAASSTPMTPRNAAREKIRDRRAGADPADEALPVASVDVPEPAGVLNPLEEQDELDIEFKESRMDEILLLDELLLDTPKCNDEGLPIQAAVRSSESPDTSARIACLEAALDSATTRDEIVALCLEIARSYSRVAALFVVRQEKVSGFCSLDEEIRARLSEVELPLSAVSIFTCPAQTRLPFRGEPPTDGVDSRVMETLGRHEVQELFISPVIIRDKTVNLLYADNGSDAFGETSIAGLTALCECLSRAYERLITDQKKQSS